MDPSTANEISELANTLDIDLFNAYKFLDIAPRVATLCLLHKWAIKSAQGDEDCLRASQSIWKDLFSFSQTDAEMVTSTYGYTGLFIGRSSACGRHLQCCHLASKHLTPAGVKNLI